MTGRDTKIGLGWRPHTWEAVVVAVSGPASAPVIVHRAKLSLVEDRRLREPYHAAAALVGGRVGAEAEPFLGKARTLIDSVEKDAVKAAAAAIRGFVSSLGPVAGMGVVGGNRKIPTDLLRILASHARLHESDRNLYEQAVIAGATRAKLPVTTIPATGTLFADASRQLGVDLATTMTALGKSVGSPWQKAQKEATAAAILALHATAT
jgi:hypothetical protein